jgi:transposase
MPMMTRRHKQGVDRRAAGSLPACLDDCVGPENPARAVDAYVDALDLSALGFAKTEPNPTAAGQPSFPPSALLKLFLYGHLNRVRSSRRLARECTRNLEAMWLLGNLSPGYRTIADFRVRNAEALRRVHAGLIARCREWRLLGGRVAVDGSHFNGNVSDKSFRSVARLEEEVRRLGERLERNAAEGRAGATRRL